MVRFVPSFLCSCCLEQTDALSDSSLSLPSEQLSLLPEQKERLLSLYNSLQEQYPRSRAITRIRLQLLDGPEFETLCQQTLTEAIQ